MNFKITTITAVVAIDPSTGDEGVWAFQNEFGAWMPMVFADEARMKSAMPMVEHMSKLPGAPPYRILQFSVREDVTEQVKAKYL